MKAGCVNRGCGDENTGLCFWYRDQANRKWLVLYVAVSAGVSTHTHNEVVVVPLLLPDFLLPHSLVVTNKSTNTVCGFQDWHLAGPTCGVGTPGNWGKGRRGGGGCFGLEFP